MEIRHSLIRTARVREEYLILLSNIHPLSSVAPSTSTATTAEYPSGSEKGAVCKNAKGKRFFPDSCCDSNDQLTVVDTSLNAKSCPRNEYDHLVPDSRDKVYVFCGKNSIKKIM